MSPHSRIYTVSGTPNLDFSTLAHAKEFQHFDEKKPFGRFDTVSGTNLASVCMGSIDCNGRKLNA